MENIHITKTLIDLGLDEKQATIYLAALDIGGGTIMELAKAGQIERTGIYYHLEELIKHGLLSRIQKGKRTYYLPSDPKRLRHLFEIKEDNLNKYLPILEKTFNQKLSKSVSSYFQGKEGLINLYEQLYLIADKLTNPNDKYYIFGHSFEAYDALPNFFPNYIKKRSKLPLLTKIILPASEKPSQSIANSDDPKIIAKYNLHIKERRYLRRKYEYPGTSLILGDYIATIDFKTYFGTLTENKNLAQTWRMFFECIWDNLPKN